ncbi:MAG: Gfo/Idh/MocA family oxidoreductase, partial [Planctomycetaceae bacterium]|nr:Gfo/Idh/MocA family oxidoreductase [Planctomycetaceae bacterium]
MLRHDVSRRKFLGGLASSSVLSAVSPRLSASLFAGTAAALRVGLVGCGGRGTGAVTQAMTADPAVKFTAMADLFQDRLDMAYKSIVAKNPDQTDIPESRKFVGFDACRNLLESDIDLVILATPPGFRPQHFRDAVAAGKHVFMEKPVAVDAPGIRQVLSSGLEAKRKNLGVQAGFQRRHDVGYVEAIKRLQDGQLGKIQSLEADWRGGGVWMRPRTKGQSELEYQLRNWYYFVWQSGDFIVEQHSHNIDVCTWLMGGPPTKAEPIQAGRNSRIGNRAGEIFDEFITRFTWGTNRLGDDIQLHSTARQILNHPDGYKVGETIKCARGVADLAKGQFEDLSGTIVWKKSGNSPGLGGYQSEWDH